MGQKAVLVTGCSSGLGKSIAVKLSLEGYLVFATVRRPESSDELKK